MDCFHERPNLLVIDPKDCIDCALCEPERPIEVIVSDEDLPDDLPEDQAEFLALNAELSPQWPVFSKKKPPRADAEQWRDKPYKRALLER